MIDKSWQTIKQQLTECINKELEQIGFSANYLDWLRHNNNVCQLVSLEKMKGSNVRLRAFVFDRKGYVIGGNVGETSFEGFYSPTGDNFWSIESEIDISNSSKQFSNVIQKVVIPVFNLFDNENKLHQVLEDYPSLPKYSLDTDKYFSYKPEQVFKLDLNYITKREIFELVNGIFSNAQFEIQVTAVNDKICLVKKTGEVTHVLEMVLINFGIQLMLRSYCWIEELSPETNGIFTGEDTVILVGGNLDFNGAINTVKPHFYNLYDSSTRLQSHDLINIVMKGFDSLKGIASKKDFIDSVPPEKSYLLKIFNIK